MVVSSVSVLSAYAVKLIPGISPNISVRLNRMPQNRFIFISCILLLSRATAGVAIVDIIATATLAHTIAKRGSANALPSRCFS